MKIKELLAHPALKVSTDLSYFRWSDLFPFDETLQRWSYTPSKEQIAKLLKYNDFEIVTFYADNSQHMELNCLYVSGTPSVIYETEDSWDNTGQVWILNDHIYRWIHETIRNPVAFPAQVTVDDDINSSYIGIKSPTDGWYDS